MRNVKLSPEETNIVFSVLNMPSNPQAGLSMQEIRKAIPILDKIEKDAIRESFTDPNTGEQGEKLIFKETLLELQEDEFDVIRTKLDSSSGWGSVQQGRKVDALFNRLKDTRNEMESESERDTK